MILAALAASAFAVNPAPMEMPRAIDAYLVREEGAKPRLEDRYDVLDLWISRAVDGVWTDDDGREFMLAALDVLPPALSSAPPETRRVYVAGLVPFDWRKDEARLFDAIDKLSPVEPCEDFSRPRRRPKGFRDVRYYQGTNKTAIVCAYLREGESFWRLATWKLREGDVWDERFAQFEDGVIYGDVAEIETARPSRADDERELLRSDARHSVAAYSGWRVTDSEEFTVLDNLADGKAFIAALTNDLKISRAKYAETVPTGIDGSNTLAVARIFATRAEYLEAAGEDMAWTAAYWNQARRELVAYLPEGDAKRLMKTIRHEAFHQYLSYACSMIPASPWFNEGYAEYFEDESDGEWGVDVNLDEAADMIAPLLEMDYGEFYAGSLEEKTLRYRLAWSIAYFIENGARKVRFDPFENLKRDYVDALVRTKDMRQAGAEAFGGVDNLRLFIAEWKKFWKNR